MLSSEVAKKIRLLEIHARRMINGMQVGNYNTAQKGSGFEFDQIREYQEGDDVRFIDWNSSVRMNKLLVRQYLEERNRTVFLLVDCSGSTVFSTHESLKSDLIAQIASVLALVADYGKDNIGLFVCSHQVETYIPAARGKDHVHTIMKTVFQASDATKKTSLKTGLKFLMEHHQKNALVFIISDFIDEDYETALASVASRYECIAIRCLDTIEKEAPIASYLTVHDPESGQEMVVDMRKQNSARMNMMLQARLNAQNKCFKKYKIDYLDVTTDRDFMADIIHFFKRRMMY